MSIEKQISIFLITALLLSFSSCMDDNAIRDFERLNTTQTQGVFIINEGNFMYSNASLSYYNPDSNIVLNNVFYNTNALPLGDVAQSMCIHDSLAYVVVNNSGKIYIINKNTFKYVGKITGLTSPRYIHFINDAKAYVSDLYAKSITVIDPLSRSVIGTIDLNNTNSNIEQHNPEQMLSYRNIIYVACWSYDDKILLINSDNDRIIDSIKVGKQPNSMVLDKNNHLWVLSDGGFSGSAFGQEKASISEIDLSNNTILKTLIFDDIDASPNHLQINAKGDSLFYIYGNWGRIPNAGIQALPITDNTLPTGSIIPQTSELFYSLGLNKENSELYISNAKDYSQAGEVYRFTSSGTPIDTFGVGINPGNFSFDN